MYGIARVLLENLLFLFFLISANIFLTGRQTDSGASVIGFRIYLLCTKNLLKHFLSTLFLQYI